ncbi:MULTISPECIES: ATP-binding protein [Paenibacillus]|uniref:ATP-binding protein n=1 Tax=Paenibacillus TaxID=44249 RepID=UPI0004B528C1|nr:ATP-binding protein [Paenibacillus sp. IHBB 10380]
MNNRDVIREIEALKQQMSELQQLVYQLLLDRKPENRPVRQAQNDVSGSDEPFKERSSVFYAGTVFSQGQGLRLEPQERQMADLLDIQTEKAAKIITALGHKQRLDILKTVLAAPLTGSELVERLHMGTTGQLYHHLKALLGADLLQQEPGGRYTVPKHRQLPLLLLLAAAGDMLDTGSYMDMAEARQHASLYFGTTGNFDAHHLLWAVMENVILEHSAGYAGEIGIFLHEHGSVTVADDGRGIPVEALPHSNTPEAQSVLTDIQRLNNGAQLLVPGAEKGISIAVVNALSEALTLEIRRDGRIHRQEYRHGIPQTGLHIIGTTRETGTSVTFTPDRELFHEALDFNRIKEYTASITTAYPQLIVTLSGSNFHITS